MPGPLLSGLVWSDVVAIAPHLSGASSGLQDTALAEVAARVSQDLWGDLAYLSGLYLAAHVGTVLAQGAQGGALQSRTVGPTSATFAVPTNWESGLSLTAYGRKYIELRMAALGPPVLVV